MGTAHITGSAILSGDESAVARAKLATLFFDKITVAHEDTLLLPEVSARVQEEPDISDEARSFFLSQWVSVPTRGLRVMQLAFKGEDVPPQLRIATERALRERSFQPQQHYDDYKWSLLLQGEILEWWREHKRSALVTVEDADAILRYCGVEESDPPRADRTLVEVPDLRSVSWNELPGLRQSRFIAAFRAKYESLLSAGNVNALAAEYGEALERLADAVRPNSRTAFANAVLSYIPFSAFNPFHARSSIEEIAHARHLEREFGWAFFLRELRSKSVRE